MSLQLILGGSGSGKTTFLYDSLIQASLENPEKSYFLIVPEQFTMQTQKDIVVAHPHHVTMNIDIVSFNRLAYRVFEELAITNLQVLDDMGKTMVLRKVAAKHHRELVVFGGQLDKNGFVNRLKSMISEFYQYGITPQALQTLAPEAKSALFSQKLMDFAVLFQAFQDYIEGHYITTEEVLDVLCRVLLDSKILKDSVIALDGYTGFTPVQYRLIELLMRHGKQVMVTATVDSEKSLNESAGIHSLFHMSYCMVKKIKNLAKLHDIEILQDIWMESEKLPRFKNSPELAHQEKYLLRYTKKSYQGVYTGGLELYQAVNPTGEISHVVHEISRLLREGGLRYRDMAVVTGDLGGYGKEIAHQFLQNQIPFFMDDKKTVLENPLVELIRGALDVVRSDFTYESVFRFLRTGFVTEDTQKLDRMETYVLALGIRGSKRWKETWERTYYGGGSLNLTELNEFKEGVLAPLFSMQEAFKREDRNIESMTEAIKDLLDQYAVKEKLKVYEGFFLKEEEYRFAKEYGQVYDLVIQLLDRLIELLGEEKVGRKEFMDILDAGFGEISVGVIPATVDRVVVGDIRRTRLAHIKVLFFVGVNDGIIPAHKDNGSLLSDREREFFCEHSQELAPTVREDNFQQRFYLYLMMTKPSKKLVVSFSVVGRDGKGMKPSFLINDLMQLFPGVVCQEQEKEDGMEIYSLTEAKKVLIKGLSQYGKAHPEGEQENLRFLELYRWFCTTQAYSEKAKQLLDAAFYIYKKQGIGREVARALYGENMNGSVTRLEQYAACAYAHFLNYGLELKERQRYELAVTDLGNLFHNSIDQCFKKAMEENRDWKTMAEEERQELVRSCVQQVTEDYGNTILSSSSRNAFLAKRVEQITQRTVWALQQQIIKGDFMPTGFEVSFSAADNLQAMKIALSDEENLYLRGRIDRLDLYEDQEHVYVKIIDYKSGSTSFDLMALYHGLQLQLVVYMDAVLELTQRKHPHKEVVPAGLFYYNIADPMITKEEGLGSEEIGNCILKQLKMNGLINSELEVIRHLDNTIEKESDIIPVVLKDDQVVEGKSSVANGERFALLREYVREKCRSTGQEILGGEVGIEPYKSGNRTACDYCAYHSVCGFDRKTSGYEFRRWKNKKSEEIWEEIWQQIQSNGQNSSNRS